MTGPAEVWFVVPDGIDDVRRPSGGNVYDRRLAEELTATGWRVHLLPVGGSWPRPGVADRAALARRLASLPDGARVLVDGLIGSAAAEVGEAAERLHVVVLLHLPLAEASEAPGVGALEGAVLRRAGAVATTSQWSRWWVVDHHRVPAGRVRVAVPGVEPGPVAARSPSGGHLLCVGPVVPDKGHDLLVAALGEVRELAWHCTVVGALDLDPPFADRVRSAASEAGIGERIDLAGPVAPRRLDDLRATTDLAVSASRHESYGMALAEALACGIPALATAVGGHGEVVARTGDGPLPGMLVPPDDAGELAAGLRRWLTDEEARRRLRAAAERRRTQLPRWAEAARVLGDVLTGPDPVNRPPRAPVLPPAGPGVDDGRRRSVQ